MKHGLFSAITRLNLLVIVSVKELADIILAISSAMTYNVLKLIDNDRMLHATSTVDQIDEITELQVLHHIEEVRDDAVRHGAWNEEHEFRLNSLGTLLCNEHDWEVEQVHRYLHEVIATGPDLDAED